MAISHKKRRRLSAQDETVGQAVCLQQAAVVNDKLQLLMTLCIRGRIHFRAKPLPWLAWDHLSGGAGGVSSPQRSLHQAQLQCVMQRGRKEKVVPETLPRFPLNLNADSSWSQGSAQCQIACQPDGTFWSSSTFIQAFRDAVRVFTGKCLFLLSSVISQPCLQVYTGVSWEQSMLWAPGL